MVPWWPCGVFPMKPLNQVARRWSASSSSRNLIIVFMSNRKLSSRPSGLFKNSIRHVVVVVVIIIIAAHRFVACCRAHGEKDEQCVHCYLLYILLLMEDEEEEEMRRRWWEEKRRCCCIWNDANSIQSLLSLAHPRAREKERDEDEDDRRPRFQAVVCASSKDCYVRLYSSLPLYFHFPSFTHTHTLTCMCIIRVHRRDDAVAASIPPIIILILSSME